MSSIEWLAFIYYPMYIMFWLADRIHLIVHYTISLSSLCKLFWRHWTYKMPVRYIFLSVWVRLRIFSQLSIIQYMGLCVFIFPISLVMIERMYTLSYYHLQIGSMNYYPLFRARSWNNGMPCMYLYILRCMFIINGGSKDIWLYITIWIWHYLTIFCVLGDTSRYFVIWIICQLHFVPKTGAKTTLIQLQQPN